MSDLIARLARIVEPGYDRASANTRRNAEITARAVLAEPDIIVTVFGLLSFSDRHAVLEKLRGSYCLECGGEAGCQCWNDE